MAFTKAYAKILAGMMPPEQVTAFRFICGLSNMGKTIVTPEVIEDLIALGLVRRDKDGKRDLILLTPNGKKLKEFV